VLQAQFSIVRGATQLMKDDIGIIMRACLILHNMIGENEHDNYEIGFDYDIVKSSTLEPIVCREHYPCYGTYFKGQ